MGVSVVAGPWAGTRATSARPSPHDSSYRDCVSHRRPLRTSVVAACLASLRWLASANRARARATKQAELNR